MYNKARKLDVPGCERIQATMDSNACKQLIAQKANVLPADVNVVMMWNYLDSSRFAPRYLARMVQENEKALAYEKKMKEEKPEAKPAEGEETEKATEEQDKGTRLDVEGLTAERLIELAESRDEEASLVRAERLTVGAGEGGMAVR